MKTETPDLQITPVSDEGGYEMVRVGGSVVIIAVVVQNILRFARVITHELIVEVVDFVSNLFLF